ncbi:hypothetical protein ANN_20171 [Periplaneta americana]|uniref:Uncharacterized protein n=1 Tax=Periplaneta americana TaxID=6978 RepID=A0ABQ8SD16_PERAM|nr:hypothetical protein ANN_20171 [Periplaneta americana]
MVARISFARRPVAPRCRSRRLKKTAAVISDAVGSEGNLSDEENTPEYSHPPSSQCSTLESNPDLPQMVQTLGSSAKKRPHCDTKEYCGHDSLQKPGTTSAESSDSESDDVSDMTIATQLGKSPKLETVLFNDDVSTTTLFSISGIGNSEMVFGEMRSRIRHRLPDIHLIVEESLEKKPNQLKRESNPCPSTALDQQANAFAN